MLGRPRRFEAARIYALASKNRWLCMLGSDQPSFEHPVLSPRWRRALEPLVDAHGNNSLKVKVRFWKDGVEVASTES